VTLITVEASSLNSTLDLEIQLLCREFVLSAAASGTGQSVTVTPRYQLVPPHNSGRQRVTCFFPCHMQLQKSFKQLRGNKI